MNNPGGREAAIVATVLTVGLIVSSGLAAFYHQRAATAHEQFIEARDEVTELRQKLLLKQANAADVVLAFPQEGPRAEPPGGGASGLVVIPPLEEEPAPEDRVRALEETLRDKDRQIAALQERATNRAPWMGRDGQRPNPQVWMQEFQRRDPEGYAAFQKRREEQHKEANDAVARQAAQLLSNDDTNLDDAQFAQRQAMLTLVNDTWQLAEQLYANPGAENRWETMHTMRQNLDQLRPMLSDERNRVFRQLGMESGYTEGDVDVFVDYLNDVIDGTSIDPLRRAMRRGASGGAWGGPPPVGAPPGAAPGVGTAPAR